MLVIILVNHAVGKTSPNTSSIEDTMIIDGTKDKFTYCTGKQKFTDGTMGKVETVKRTFVEPLHEINRTRQYKNILPPTSLKMIS